MSAAAPTLPDLPDTAWLVLGILRDGRPRSGYDVYKRAGWLEHLHAAPAHSQIYRELKRLEALALVDGRDVPQEGRPDKRLHVLTPAGRAALTAWVEGEGGDAAGDAPELPSVRHPLALRLAFGEGADPARLRAELRAYLERLEARLGQIAIVEEALAEGVEDPDGGSRLAALWGRHRLEAERRAARETLELLAPDEASVDA